jgi:hypothetical protein
VTSSPQGESRRSDGQGPGDRQPPSRSAWYGWQTLLVDGVSLTVLVATGVAENNKYLPWDAYAFPVYTGLAGYLLGPPIVHAARDHWGKAGGSAAMRAGSLLILTGAIVECLQENTQNENSGCTSNPLFWFGVLSVPATVALDAALIAHEDVRLDEGRLRLAPWIDAKSGRGGVVLSGAF